MNLPDLPYQEEGSTIERTKLFLANLLSEFNSHLPNGMDLNRKGLRYRHGDDQLLLGKNGLKLNAKDILGSGIDLNANLNRDGNLSAEAQRNLFGGRLGLDYQRRPDDSRYYLKYERNF